MPGARSDAATDTDDIHLQGRPLCLFYFSEPFAVLSATPPRVSPLGASPPADMSPPASSYAASSSSRPSFDVGAATVHRRPLQLVSLPPTRFDSFSSTLLSSDAWLDSSSSSRRAPPVARLPPLRLPSPLDSFDWCSSDDVLPAKCRHPVKFSLPPISLPLTASSVASSGRARGEAWAPGRAAAGPRRALGVRKVKKRARLSGVRRMLTCLMQRTVKGRRDCGTPAIQAVLATVREAWPPPRPLRPPSSSSASSGHAVARPAPPAAPTAAMRAQLAELPPRPGASPGLLRRRYSVPETIMRKYRLAQVNSDGDECAASTIASRDASPASPPRGSCASLCGGSGGEAARFQRRDREVMRKSALLRRLWGRPCHCHVPPAPRSLDSSRAELRPELRAPLSPGWATPKRQRLDSPEASHGSDDMLRAAMRNSFERGELSERRARHADSSDAPLSDSRTSHSEDSGGDPASSETACRCATPPPASPPAPAAALAPASASLALSRPAHIDVRVSEVSDHYENEDQNVLPYVRPPDTPSYEVLEIVVSETFNSTGASDLSSLPALKTHSPDRLSATSRGASVHGIDIDEYVSHILVESLNSLTDQIENMNASIGGDRKISIVEKEIKVKLQNTGVNTIVHLSPTSNHQIIFGNEELCNREEAHQVCDSGTAQFSTESNNNLTASVADTPRDATIAPDDCLNDNYVESSEVQDQVNQAVLQQIQKLFQEELRSLDASELKGAPAAVRHVEVSNVDVYVEQHSPLHSLADTIELRTQRELSTSSDAGDHVAGLGAGNYYESAQPPSLVARRTALPHSASMEVNTSSSSEASLGSCASLVDSLDDPASPRAPPRRSLTRSGVDVLELLPEARRPRERAEAFFIRIDDECECGAEGGVVADRMPDRLRERLLRRQRRRELRAECARHRRAKQLRRELERQRRAEQRRLEHDAAAALDALLDDIVLKVAQDELKCMRIKNKSRNVTRKSSENLLEKRNWQKSNESLHDESLKVNKNASFNFSKTSKEIILKGLKEKPQVHGKLSLPPPRPPPAEPAPRRLYQKSEIHNGDKCIEILEILEYVDTSPSSPETTNSDEIQSLTKRKSRIPIPIYERIQRIPKSKSNELNSYERDRRTREVSSRNADDTSQLLASMLLQSLRAPAPAPAASTPSAARRASVPQQEPRSRSNSLRFKRVFDMIPEEKSSLSVESSAEDATNARRVSAPALPAAPAAPASPAVKHASTSPLSRLTRHAATSPLRRSAATSPAGGGSGRSWFGLGRKEGSKESRESERNAVLKSASTQYEPLARARSTVRTIEAGKEAAVIVGRAPRAPPPPPRPPARDKKPPERRKKTDKTKTDGSKRRPREPSALQSLSEPGGAGGGGGGGGGGAGEEGSSSESGSSLLCALAPRWLSRHRRPRRRDDDSRHTAQHLSASTSSMAGTVAGAEAGVGAKGGAEEGAAAAAGWSVTVAGAGRAALPSDLQMRLSFPPPHAPSAAPVPAPPPPRPHHHSDSGYGDDCRQQRHRQECACRRCTECLCLPPAPAAAPANSLALRKHSIGSSILGDKNYKRPELPAVPRAARAQRSVKMRRGCSPHCWLPDAPLSAWSGASEGQLSVRGAALVPRRKPRLVSNTERALPAPSRSRPPPLRP